MVDTLYPIMGGMISMYVTQSIKEIMEVINHKIEDGLSFAKYKRKIKAKISGVSESELLLQESNYAIIRSFFIIEKETSLLIAEEHITNEEIADPHMVASMASAIKDFINDWVSTHQEYREVQLLSYGDATLYIESAGSIYLIAFIHSEPDYEQRRKIQQFFAKIVKGYSSFFKEFNGDDSNQEIFKIKRDMQCFLDKQMHNLPKKEKKEKPLIKYFFLFLILLSLIYLIFIGKEKYSIVMLEKNILEQTGEHIVVLKHKDKLHIQGHAKSVKKYNKIEKTIKDMGYTNYENDVYLLPQVFNKKIVKQKNLLFQFQQTMKEELDTMKIQISNIEENLSLTTKKYQKSKKKVKKIHSIENIETTLLENLRQEFDKECFLNKEDGTLNFRENKLFIIAESRLNEKILIRFGNVFRRYIQVVLKDEKVRTYLQSIMVYVYTDSTGNNKLNNQLTSERALILKEYLASLDISKKYYLENIIIAKGLGNKNLVYNNGIEDKKASRRIKIKVLFDYKKMLKDIKDTIND